MRYEQSRHTLCHALTQRWGQQSSHRAGPRRRRVDRSLRSADSSLANRQTSTDRPFSSPGSEPQRWLLSGSCVHPIEPALCPVLSREPTLLTTTIYGSQVSFRENVCLLCRRSEGSFTGNMVVYCPPANVQNKHIVQASRERGFI